MTASPDQYPQPPELSESETFLLDQLYESHFGPIIGNYIPTKVTHGNHPKDVKDAWIGASMPVRKYFAGELECGSVPIAAGEAFNALVAKGTPDEVLQYWIDRLPETPSTTLTFSLEEGTFHLNEDH